MRKEEYREEDAGVNPMQMGVAMFSPSKILVESATMIFIIAFMLLTITILVYKGPQMGSTESMVGVLALFVTFLIAGRQYASFR
jgi:hypothetical protein|tara:strand:- start:5178 stop:5429 length:252 start_codon:yes stop_codon:yes gene_type:complete